MSTAGTRSIASILLITTVFLTEYAYCTVGGGDPPGEDPCPCDSGIVATYPIITIKKEKCKFTGVGLFIGPFDDIFVTGESLGNGEFHNMLPGMCSAFTADGAWDADYCIIEPGTCEGDVEDWKETLFDIYYDTPWVVSWNTTNLVVTDEPDPGIQGQTLTAYGPLGFSENNPPVGGEVEATFEDFHEKPECTADDQNQSPVVQTRNVAIYTPTMVIETNLDVYWQQRTENYYHSSSSELDGNYTFENGILYIFVEAECESVTEYDSTTQQITNGELNGAGSGIALDINPYIWFQLTNTSTLDDETVVCNVIYAAESESNSHIFENSSSLPPEVSDHSGSESDGRFYCIIEGQEVSRAESNAYYTSSSQQLNNEDSAGAAVPVDGLIFTVNNDENIHGINIVHEFSLFSESVIQLDETPETSFTHTISSTYDGDIGITISHNFVNQCGG